jgi:hypothetical protein
MVTDFRISIMIDRMNKNPEEKQYHIIVMSETTTYKKYSQKLIMTIK